MSIASQDQSLPSSNSYGGTEFGQVFLQISWHGGLWPQDHHMLNCKLNSTNKGTFSNSIEKWF